MDKLIFEGNEYELFLTNFPQFVVHQDNPYPIDNIPAPTYWAKRKDLEPDQPSFIYNSIRFNGRYYGYRLIS